MAIIRKDFIFSDDEIQEFNDIHSDMNYDKSQLEDSAETFLTQEYDLPQNQKEKDELISDFIAISGFTFHTEDQKYYRTSYPISNSL